MKHIPIGYRISDGVIVVDEKKAVQVKVLFECYYKGYSLQQAAKTANIKGYHGTISRILSNEKYVGELNYPAIISKSLFDEVQKIRKEKARKLGRDHFQPKIKERIISTQFMLKEQRKVFDDPVKEAEYRYRLIEVL